MAISLSPNVLVSDLAVSVDFYVNGLGAEIAFTLDADQNADMSGGIIDAAVFASLRVGSSEMMLQERSSLRADLPGVVEADGALGGTVSLYFRVDDVFDVLNRMGNVEIVKAPELKWYGMREVWIRDPDGYLVTLGAAEGNAPEL